MDRIIKALPKNIADKIAAGEVVERPLSIVKELLENSVDAGATCVTIEIQKGGKEYIRVTDNGCGIERLQLELAFKRYATSKIATEDDLNAIGTLGFRGEALASIASVSNVKLISKTRSNPVGASIELKAGDVVSISDAACEDGTTIVITDLFFNTPARKKFLKPDNIESSLIIDFVSKMAIAYPKLSIRLISNKSILFATNGSNDLLANIYTVYGPQFSQGLVPVKYQNDNMSIQGYISSPSQSKNNKKWQIFFVNGRLIKSKLLDDSISEAYHDKLFEGHYPLCFLFLDLDPKSLDVNIHPHKTEIRFYEEDNIKEFIVKGIRNALLNPDAMKPKEVLREKTSENVVLPKKEYTSIPEDYKVVEYETSVDVFDIVNNIDDEEIKLENIFKEIREEEYKPQYVQEEIVTYKSDRLFFSNLEYVGQVFNTYLLCKDVDSFYIIDQHAAHERVMFEKLWADYNKEANNTQILLNPIVITLSLANKHYALERLHDLANIGFEIEDFGPDSFVVKSLPSCMEVSEAEDFLNEFFDAINEYKDGFKFNMDKIITRSCKAAVKAHDNLKLIEVKRLFEDLDKCENPYSCPHGRPTFVKYSSYELERLFKRK